MENKEGKLTGWDIVNKKLEVDTSDRSHELFYANTKCEPYITKERWGENPIGETVVFNVKDGKLTFCQLKNPPKRKYSGGGASSAAKNEYYTKNLQLNAFKNVDCNFHAHCNTAVNILEKLCKKDLSQMPPGAAVETVVAVALALNQCRAHFRANKPNEVEQ